MFSSLQKRGSKQQVTWQIPGTLIDIDFTRNLAAISGHLVPIASLIACTRASVGYAQRASGLWTPFASGAPRITDQGLLCEEARTNSSLYARDMTKSVWTKTGCTAALTAVGIDGTAAAATMLTAIAANATALQAITLASAIYTYDVSIKRVSGSGEVDITMNGGATWQSVPVTAAWQRFFITNTLANPQIGVRLTTSGDVVAIDFNQLEAGSSPLSPILTTTAAASRASDIIAAIGPLFEALTGATSPVLSIYTQHLQGPIPTDGQRYLYVIFDRTYAYILNLAGYYTNGVPLLTLISSVNSAYLAPTPGLPIGGIAKSAVALQLNDVAMASFDGSLQTSSTFTPQSTVGGAAFLGGNDIWGGNLDSYLQRFAVAKTRHSNAALQAWVNA